MPKEELLHIAEDIAQNDKEIKTSPRKLLGYFNFEKRTKWNITKVNQFLEKNYLETEPDYTNVWFDSQIILKHKKKAKSKKDTDPIQRVKLLPAANKPLISVNRDSKLNEAITLMMLHNYSQLPIINGPKSIVGFISWETIGYGLSNNFKSEDVKDFMSTNVSVLDYETPLLDAINTVIEKEFVIVQKNDKTLTGIVTIADISSQFYIISEPFLLLEQIENHIRQLLDGKFLLQEVKDFCKTGEIERDIEHIDNLNFGDYVRLIEKPEHWKKLKLSIDRIHFTKQLNKIRDIRNDIMHFDPEGISNEQREDLNKMAKFLVELRKYN